MRFDRDPLPVCGFATHEGELLGLGDGDRAVGHLRYMERELAELPASVDGVTRALATWRVGMARQRCGDSAGAEAMWAAALATPAFVASDSWRIERRSFTIVLVSAGELDRAEPFARDDLRDARDDRERVASLHLLAEILMRLARYRESLPILHDALAASIEQGGSVEGTALRRLATAHAALDDVPAALEWIGRAEAATETLAHDERAKVLIASAELHLRAGHVEAARAKARAARDWYVATMAARAAFHVDETDYQRACDELAARWQL